MIDDVFDPMFESYFKSVGGGRVKTHKINKANNRLIMWPVSTNQESDWLNFPQPECSLCETLDPSRPPQTNVHTWSGTEAATDRAAGGV